MFLTKEIKKLLRRHRIELCLVSLWDSCDTLPPARNVILNKAETIPFNDDPLVRLFLFLTCPDSFEIYIINAGYLSEPLFKLHLFGLLSVYSVYSNLPTWLILAGL